ncbi:unnamed protein product [Prorocentrum cordatum]|uniref:Uncharacterized protein n=1 Tax=Prorocentrum cordatum TaxID=2364126 RepID=A0ABN9WML8_9DINO|nr:unnamed protein product [Polarella glacialis]
MQALHAHYGKTSRSSLCLVAAAVETTCHWNTRMTEYIKALKDIDKLDSSYQEAATLLTTMTDDPCEFVPLMRAMCRNMGLFKEKLPPMATADMLEAFQMLVEAKHAIIMDPAAPPEHVDRAVLPKWQEVLSEATILFPMAEPLSQAMLSVGTKLQDMTRDAQLDDVRDKLEKLARPHDDDRESDWLQAFALTDCSAVIKFMTEIRITAEHPLASIAVRLANTIVHCLSTEIGGGRVDDARLHETVVVAAGLANQCGASLDGLAVETAALEKTLAVKSIHQDLLARGPAAHAIATDSTFELVVSLTRATAQLHELQKGGAEGGGLPAVVGNVLEDAQTFLRAVHGEYVQGACVNLNGKIKEAKTISGGMGDKYWTEYFKGETWDDFMKHAGRTVLKQNPDDVVAATDGLARALVLYQTHADAGGIEQKAELVDLAKQELCKLDTTKFQGCLMYHFKSEKTAASLRSRAQAEVKAFKAKHEDYAKALPSLLGKQVKEALAMKLKF